MYSLYKLKVSNPVSRWIYQKVFSEFFKLSFGRYVLLVSACCMYTHCFLNFVQATKVWYVQDLWLSECEDSSWARLYSQRLQGELATHQAKDERAYQQLNSDTALAKSDDTVKLITFDLEHTLPTPSISTNVVFYRRQLWTYNLGIRDGDTGRGCMHMWHEGIAGRGSCEVASCTLKHIREMNTDPEVNHLITYTVDPRLSEHLWSPNQFEPFG